MTKLRSLHRLLFDMKGRKAAQCVRGARPNPESCVGDCGAKREPRARRDRLRLGEARASGSAKAALRGRGFHIREVANPRTIPFSQFVWRATPPHGIGPSRPLAATYRAVGGHNCSAARRFKNLGPSSLGALL